MILIADSGSTKTDWCVVGQGQLVRQIGNERHESFLSIRGRNRE